MAIGPRRADTGGAAEPGRGYIGGAVGSCGGDTGGANVDREHEAQGTPSNPEEETLEAPSDPEEETLEAPLDSEQETKMYQGMTKGQRIWKGRSYPRVGTSPSVAIFRQIMSRRTWSRRVYAGVEEAGPQSSLPTSEEGDEESMCDSGGTCDFLEEGGATGVDSEGHVTGAVNRQQAMNTPDMEKWRKARKKKCKVARPNDKLVVGARVIYNRKVLDRTERSKSTDVDLPPQR